MTAPLLALSLSNTVLKAGALAAFAALVGIAVLSLLVFSQARELKRLREWAGRAPERAVELEQRVSADAAARAQQIAGPRTAGTVAVAPIPRTTPIVTRATPAGPSTGAPPAGASVGAPTPAAPAPATAAGSTGVLAASPGEPPADQRPADQRPADRPPAVPASTSSAPAAPAPGPGQPQVPGPQAPTPVPGQPAFMPTGEQSPASAAAQARPQAAVAAGEESQPAAVGGVGDNEAAENEGPEPAGAEAGFAPAAAAVAAGSTGRVAAGATALSEGSQVPAAPGVPTPATVAARAAAPPRPPAPRAPVPPRAGTAPAAAPRGAAAPRPRASRSAADQPLGGARPAGGRGGMQGPPFLREERSAGRTTAVIVGGVVLGVAVLVGVLLSLGGGSNSGRRTGSTASRSVASGKHGSSHHGHAATAVASPAETHVVVLNATETNGLAHRLSANLQQSGYTQSAALDGHPAGRSTSVVEYASGHHTEAEHVAQTLGIAQVSPLEGAVVPLAGGATVVVIAGADQSATAGEASSGSGSPGAGEPSANGGTGGESSAGGETSGGAAQ
jgi:LytR cell envelope-related transcriptional attenuator